MYILEHYIIGNTINIRTPGGKRLYNVDKYIKDQTTNKIYNDDLVMSFGIGMFLRDTSLKFQQMSHDMTRATLGNMSKTNYLGGYNSNKPRNPYSIQTDHGQEDIKWLL